MTRFLTATGRSQFARASHRCHRGNGGRNYSHEIARPVVTRHRPPPVVASAALHGGGIRDRERLDARITSASEPKLGGIARGMRRVYADFERKGHATAR